MKEREKKKRNKEGDEMNSDMFILATYKLLWKPRHNDLFFFVLQRTMTLLFSRFFIVL